MVAIFMLHVRKLVQIFGSFEREANQMAKKSFGWVAVAQGLSQGLRSGLDPFLSVKISLKSIFIQFSVISYRPLCVFSSVACGPIRHFKFPKKYKNRCSVNSEASQGRECLSHRNGLSQVANRKTLLPSNAKFWTRRSD
jgi:hypothetical protein